jgi:lipopolysaccharide/colanic/teichoic acid biosynthesis glycosyltransferase
MVLLYVGEDFLFKKYSKQNQEVRFIVKSNGLEATKELQHNRSIDAVISQYDLPGNNGLFFLKKIKEDATLAKLPTVILVDEHKEHVYKDAFKIGVLDYYVNNTVSIDRIIKRIKFICKWENDTLKEIKANNSLLQYKIPISKRIFDIAFASIILIILSPILLVIMLAIRLESKGKVYYMSKRVGRKSFDFYKLRSMRSGADKLLNELAEKKNQYNTSEVDFKMDLGKACPKCSELPRGQFCSPLKYAGIEKICDYFYNKQKEEIKKQRSSFIKIVDDPRITRIGKIIRNTSIDELPQLINVIKGDMSLVGNRPLPLYEAELLTKDQMSKRFLAPAGITGLWQVELRGEGGEMSESERIDLDNKYADYFIGQNYSFWFDIKILLRTIPALFQKSTV